MSKIRKAVKPRLYQLYIFEPVPLPSSKMRYTFVGN